MLSHAAGQWVGKHRGLKQKLPYRISGIEVGGGPSGPLWKIESGYSHSSPGETIETW